MANDCWNSVIITGDVDTLKEIEARFNSFEKGVLNYGNYHKMFDIDMSYMTDEDWGPKWFLPWARMDGDDLVVTGDSAWSPQTKLFELISSEYCVDVSMTYEERGMDFAGQIKWEEGDCISENEYTYWEYKYLNETDTFYEEAEECLSYEDSVDVWMESLNIDEWNQKPDIDMDRLNKVWESYQN
jgi:hypothetical protein